MGETKPKITLNEHKVSKDHSRVIRSEQLGNMRKKFGIVIVRNEDDEMEFDMIGIHPFLANTLRRIMISEVSSMAIDKVVIQNNTSVIQDEVLAHRLGQIPLKADARFFEVKADAETEGSEIDTLEYELKIKCSFNKNAQKDSARPEDMYKNNNVYSSHIKWIPIGNQANNYKEADVGPIHSDILIAKLRPGHEIDLKMYATKSHGSDHAKFSPVATAYYRLLPEIKLTREVTGEQAERLQKCFSAGVIGLRKKGDVVSAFVKDARYDMSSRNVFRYDDLKDAVVMNKVDDHFIFTIESVGALQPADIFRESVRILKKKCVDLLNELNQTY